LIIVFVLPKEPCISRYLSWTARHNKERRIPQQGKKNPLVELKSVGN